MTSFYKLQSTVKKTKIIFDQTNHRLSIDRSYCMVFDNFIKFDQNSKLLRIDAGSFAGKHKYINTESS